MTIRYAAWHESSPGYETASEVEEYIARQEDSQEWRVVATTDEFGIDKVAEDAVLWRRQSEIKAAEERGAREERRRIRNLLGL